MAEDKDYDEPEAEAPEAEDEGDDYEMDMKSVAKAIGQVTSVLKTMNARLDRLEKESPPEDNLKGSEEDVDREEHDQTVAEPDEDAATKPGDGDENEGTGDAMTKRKPVSKGRTPKPVRSAPVRASGDLVQKAVNDGAFLRKSWQNRDIRTVANAAAEASRQFCGKSNTGGIRQMGGNDAAKYSLLKWCDKSFNLGVFKDE